MTIQNKRLTVILSLVGIVLLIPFVAMQFTNEVNWSAADFLVAGVLLISAGLLCEFVLRMFTRRTHRIVICAVVIIGLLLVWAELAVGVFGSTFAGS